MSDTAWASGVAALGLAVLVTLITGASFVVNAPGLLTVAALAIAVAGAVTVAVAFLSGRQLLAAAGLILVAMAPAGFFYVGNIVCLSAAAGLGVSALVDRIHTRDV